jgi:hypothetical protein
MLQNVRWIPQKRNTEGEERRREEKRSKVTSKGSLQFPITNLSIFPDSQTIEGDTFLRPWDGRNKNETHSDLFFPNLSTLSQIQWPRGLRHELCSPARMLGS